MSIQLVQHITVGSGGVASVTFSAIPQTGTGLILQYSARKDGSAQNYGRLRFNSDTSNNYIDFSIQALGPFAYPSNYYPTIDFPGAATSSIRLLLGLSSQAAGCFSNGTVEVFNYTSTADKSVNKNIATESNENNTPNMEMGHGIYTGGAITSLTVVGVNDLIEHSTFSLYQIMAD